MNGLLRALGLGLGLAGSAGAHAEGIKSPILQQATAGNTNSLLAMTEQQRIESQRQNDAAGKSSLVSLLSANGNIQGVDIGLKGVYDTIFGSGAQIDLRAPVGLNDAGAVGLSGQKLQNKSVVLLGGAWHYNKSLDVGMSVAGTRMNSAAALGVLDYSGTITGRRTGLTATVPTILGLRDVGVEVSHEQAGSSELRSVIVDKKTVDTTVGNGFTQTTEKITRTTTNNTFTGGRDRRGSVIANIPLNTDMQLSVQVGGQSLKIGNTSTHASVIGAGLDARMGDRTKFHTEHTYAGNIQTTTFGVGHIFVDGTEVSGSIARNSFKAGPPPSNTITIGMTFPLGSVPRSYAPLFSESRSQGATGMLDRIMGSQNFANPQAVGRVDTKTKTEIISEQVTRTPDSVVVPINSLQISDDGTVTVSFTPLVTQQKQSSNIAYASSATSRATSSINTISSSVKYILIITAPDTKTQYGVEVSSSPAQIQLDKSLPPGIYTATLRTINTIDGKQKITEASSHFSVYSDAPEQISAELVASSVTATGANILWSAKDADGIRGVKWSLSTDGGAPSGTLLMTDTTVSLVNGLPGSRNFVTLSLEFLQKNKDGTATWKSYTKRVEVNLKESLDKTPPTITLAGAPVMNIAFGSIYTDPGATCIDNKDATCTVVTTGTVDTSKTGTYTIIYTATDKAGNITVVTRSIIVKEKPLPENTAPSKVTFAQAGVLNEGSLTAGNTVGFLSCTDTDPTGLPNTCSYSGGSENFLVLPSGAVKLLNENLRAGDYVFTVSAKDVQGLVRSELVKFTVSERLNSGPNTFPAIIPISFIAGSTGSVILPATTHPKGYALIYTLVETLPVGFSFDATTRMLSWKPGAQPGALSLTLRATDTENKSITILVPVTVTAAQDAPTVENIPTVSAITYNSVNISYNISDPDGLTNPICEVQTTTGTVIGSPMTPVNGLCAFVGLPANTQLFAVTKGFAVKGLPDGSKQVIAVEKRAPFTTAAAPNLPPNALPDITLIAFVAGTTGSTTLPATTDPEGKVITYAITGTFPAGFAFDPATRTFSWTQGMDPGAYTFTYKAADPNGASVTKAFTANVTAAQDTATIANPPTISDITPTSVKVTVNISDFNGVSDLACQLKNQAGNLIGSPLTPVNGICLFTGLLPSTTYAVVTTGKANELQANGAIVARSVAKDAPFTTAVAPDTTPPVLQSASIQGGELVTGSPIIGSITTDDNLRAGSYDLKITGTDGSFAILSGAVTTNGSNIALIRSIPMRDGLGVNYGQMVTLLVRLTNTSGLSIDISFGEYEYN